MGNLTRTGAPRLIAAAAAAIVFVAGASALAPALCQAAPPAPNAPPKAPAKEPVKVFSAGACERFVAGAAARFKKEHGRAVVIEEGTVGQLVERISEGEQFDVALLTPAGVQRVPEGFLAGAPMELARVGIGVVVRQNAPRPDIATLDAFEQTLRQARSIAYVDPAAGGTSGIYFSHLLERLGLAEEVRPKAVLVPGGAVAQRVASGQAEIGIQMMSELTGVKGVTLIGPLPAPIQTYTVYSGVLSASPSDAEAARELLDLLASAAVDDLLKGAGLERPPAAR